MISPTNLFTTITILINLSHGHDMDCIKGSRLKYSRTLVPFSRHDCLKMYTFDIIVANTLRKVSFARQLLEKYPVLSHFRRISYPKTSTLSYKLTPPKKTHNNTQQKQTTPIHARICGRTCVPTSSPNAPGLLEGEDTVRQHVHLVYSNPTPR
jgi:hypothetical protein